MAKFTYPSTDLDKPGRLLALLGSHWSQHYDGAHAVAAMLQGAAQLEQQNLRDLQELYDCTTPATTPLYHTERWWPLTLQESQLNSVEGLGRYGDEYIYGAQLSGVGDTYGVRKDRSWVFPRPAGLVSCSGMYNRLTDPSLSWQHGVEVLIDVNRNSLTFVSNPFESDLLPVRPVYRGATVVDREVRLWLFNAQFDRSYLTKHFGYLFGIQATSTNAAREFLTTLLNGLSQGPSRQHAVELMAALTDIPLAKGAEVVETVLRDSRGLAIVTDKRCYRYPSDAVPVVAAGDAVVRGDALVDTLQVYEFNRGGLSAEIKALAVSGGLLNSGYFGDLIFENKSVALTVEPDVHGYTKISWPIGGIPTDVAKFWDDLHVAGIAARKTLAMLLDTRSNPTGQPSAVALPRTINPLKFLAENVWRNNLGLIRLKAKRLGQEALPMSYGHWLRELTPPGAYYLLLLELEAGPTTITMDTAGTETEGGFAETAIPFDSIETVGEDLLPSTYMDEYPLLRYDTDFCV